MSFEISVTTNSREVHDWLLRFFHQQVPFATSRALNATVESMRDDLIRDMPKRFKVRAKSLPKAAITTQKSHKRDWPHLEARVGVRSKFEFLVMHEEGGTKKPQRGAKNIAIPTKAIKHTASGKVRARMKPRRLVEEDRGRFAGKPGSSMIVRDARRSRVNFRNRFAVLYLLRRKVQIRPRWGFRTRAVDTARQVYDEHFAKEFWSAVRNAKASRGPLLSMGRGALGSLSGRGLSLPFAP